MTTKRLMRLDSSGTSSTLWRQLTQILTDFARSNPPGTKIPSESELSATYGISRATIRRALDSLIAENVLISRQGVGTFVAPSQFAERLQVSSGVKSIDEVTREIGATPGVEILAVHQDANDHSVKQILKLLDTDEILEIVRLRTANGIPLAYHLTYIPTRIFPEAGNLDFHHGSVRSLLASAYGFTFTEVEVTASAVELTEELGAHLTLAAGSASLLLERVSYIENRTPGLYSKIFLNPKLYTLRFAITL